MEYYWDGPSSIYYIVVLYYNIIYGISGHTSKFFSLPLGPLRVSTMVACRMGPAAFNKPAVGPERTSLAEYVAYPHYILMTIDDMKGQHAQCPSVGAAAMPHMLVGATAAHEFTAWRSVPCYTGNQPDVITSLGRRDEV